tara:strand:+ start:2158 stop:2490 length:333 start_codon:yes stop_codon:yes gene_type:complete
MDIIPSIIIIQIYDYADNKALEVCSKSINSIINTYKCKICKYILNPNIHNCQKCGYCDENINIKVLRRNVFLQKNYENTPYTRKLKKLLNRLDTIQKLKKEKKELQWELK